MIVFCRLSPILRLTITIAKQTTNKATDRRALRYHRWIAISRKNTVAGAAQLTALLENDASVVIARDWGSFGYSCHRSSRQSHSTLFSRPTMSSISADTRQPA